MERGGFRVQVWPVAAGSEGEVGVLMLYVIADGVLDGGGEGELEVWVGG